MFIEAFVFGLTIAVAIGPIALIIINAAINRGLRAGLACGAGAASADFVFALGGFLAGAAALSLLDAHRRELAVLAAFILCALGIWMIRTAWSARHRAAPAAHRNGPGFFATFLLTLANPLTILFFAAWIGGRAAPVSPLEAVTLALFVFAGSLLVQSLLAAGGALLRGALTRPRVLLAANLVSGGGITAFGLARLMQL